MTPALGQFKPTPVRECAICGAGFERRAGERRQKFLERQTCGKECRMELQSRIQLRVPPPVLDPETGCLLWQGAVDTHGYAHRGRRGRIERVHRVVYEEAYGPIPPGHDLHHRCETRRCVNPQHLQPLTHSAHSRLTHANR